ncbi:hypothetical protein DAEQUDRAFT_769156 [Daedalea quercina L-15889]|uniref:Meiotically up-regulated protein Msb1/Mug8 domain-containing protein n=1 Tax=Daedalea quercina L-15889 TaxID=1314783 RepID=A0A165M1A4_9APHY|nr:hypothetical protein DAEQUDRAFT_769156 [Daedalea quercina L-15889]
MTFSYNRRAMPSFLSKVFTRKKDEKDASHPPKRTSVPSLLEGKFEAVSPPASPSATNVAHSQSVQKEERKEKEKEKEAGFSLFRTRSPRPTSPKTDAAKSELPHLTLNLPEEKAKDGRQLGVVLETDVGDRSVVPDHVIGERRLNPSEALKLVKACSTAIIDLGGLETLGVMHPHWYSASPDVQRKLISLFILSLASNSPSTLPPSPSSPSALFNTELEYTRSPHDLAAVLRWALRHLRLEGDFFGIGSSGTEPWQWYKKFSEAERVASYPPNAFSQFLTPQLPPAHLQLLLTTLEILSSLAAHSDRSGVSGSKLSKLLGLWLLTARRAETSDDWTSFYARWERAGRIMEHLLLAQIRDETTHTKVPRRLIELVAGYPYLKGSEPEDDLLPRPRLSTRTYDALYVRLETQLPDFTVPKPKQSPRQIIADAVEAEGTSQAGEYDGLWELLKQQADATEKVALSAEDDASPALTRVFTDETTRLLSMLPAEDSRTQVTTIKLEVPEPRGRSRSVETGQNGAVANGAPRATMSTTDLSPKDWTDFSSLGFGESALGKDFASTLMDNDVEVTEPRLVRRKSSRRQKASTPADVPLTSRTVTLPTKCASVNIVQVDEAFIDFWSDALLDPIASDWPSFIVCQLRPVPGFETNGKLIDWLVIEQVFTRPPPPPEPESPTLHRTISPKPSLRSNISARKSATFSNAKKRFTLFSSKETIGSLDAKLATRKKTGKSARIGEMGEILPEEPEPQQTTEDKPAPELRSPDPTSAEVATAVAAIAVAGTAAAVVTEKINADLPPVPIVQAEAPAAEAATSISAVKNDEEPADKPTKFVEHITPPTNTTPASSEEAAADDDVVESNGLPPAPEPVVLTGETPGPDVALSTSEPVALAEASAHARAEPIESPNTREQPASVEEVQPAAEAEPQPQPQPVSEPTVDAAVTESPEPAPTVIEASAPPVDVATPEPEVTLPAAASVQEAPAAPEVEPEELKTPLAATEEATADVETAVERPAPVAEPVLEGLSTEEEPTVGPTSTVEEAVAEPTAEVAVAKDESKLEPADETHEPVVPREPQSTTTGGPVIPQESTAAAPEENAVAPPEEPGAAPPGESTVTVPPESGVEESTSRPADAPPETEGTAVAKYAEEAPALSGEPEQCTQAADETQNGSAHEDKAGDAASPGVAA